MARTFTLSELRTKVRERCDMQNTEFVSDSELSGYISASYTWLYDLLVRKGLRYFESTQTITADGSASYALPSDYYGTIAVDYQYGTNDWWEVPEYMIQERNNFNYYSNDVARGYSIVGDYIKLLPAQSSGTYRHLYVPAPDDLSSDSDTVDGVSGWEELVVLDAAIKCLRKEESDTKGLERDLARLEARIEEAAENRALASPRRVADVYTRYDDWYQGRGRWAW